MISARGVFALGLLMAGTAQAERIGPFDGALSPAPPRPGDSLQLDLSNARSCVAPLPTRIDVQRSGAELEVHVGSVDQCSSSTPAQARAYALGVVEPGVERIVVYSCEGNPPPGAPRCRAAFTVATASGAIAGQDIASVPATSPMQLAVLAVVTLLAGLVASRRAETA